MNSVKHELVWKNFSQDASGVQTIVLSLAVEPASVNIASEVSIGSSIKGVYLEFQFSTEGATTTMAIDWYVAKLPFATAIGVPSVYNDPTRRFILKRGMEMLPKNVNTIIKRIIFVRIPPRMSRQGENDELVFRYISSSTVTINTCGFAIYTELK